MPGYWPDRSFQHGDRKFIYPLNAAEAERVLESAYRDYENGLLSYDEYTKQKAICYKAKYSDGPSIRRMFDPEGVFSGGSK